MEVDNLEKLVDYYHENRLSHVYLLETNDVLKCTQDLLHIIKQICCPKDYQDSCQECNLCNLIDKDSLPSLYTIEPEGSSIKKEQIIDLKKRFSLKPIYTKDNIYIIKNAESFTASSANTMLKFLEEPEDNIIGFLITNNINNVLDTIKSRCELISIQYDSNIEIDEDKKNIIKEYLYKIEIEKKDLIFYNKDVLLKNYADRSDIKTIFKYILEVYKNLFTCNASDEWSFLENLNLNDRLKRIHLATDVLDGLENNANIELLLDRFIIELSE